MRTACTSSSSSSSKCTSAQWSNYQQKEREREQRQQALTPTGLLAKLVAPDPSVPFFSAAFDNAIKGCPGRENEREREQELLAAKRLPLFETSLPTRSSVLLQSCSVTRDVIFLKYSEATASWAPLPAPSGLHLLYFSLLFSVSTWVCSLRMRSWSELAFACLAFALLQALAAVGWSNYLLATSLSLSLFSSFSFLLSQLLFQTSVWLHTGKLLLPS